MPQLFRPSANTVARVSIIGGVLAPVIIGYGIAALSRSPANTKVDVPLNQPIPFSHQHHAYELGLDCRYCHTGVETSPYAGLPPTETCMSCHSQIWINSPLLEPLRQSYETGTPLKWNLVNKTPEFVYFRHDIHIARGINCNTCHGPVTDMHITYKGNSFQMQWCLTCHRAPERYLYRDPEHPDMKLRDKVFALYWKYQSGEKLTDREMAQLKGEDIASDDPAVKKVGRDIIKEYGIKVQQLADCTVCHR